jgi:hypothetical protein
MSKRGNNSYSSVVIETASNLLKIANMRKIFTESRDMIRHRDIKSKDDTDIASGRYRSCRSITSDVKNRIGYVR